MGHHHYDKYDDDEYEHYEEAYRGHARRKPHSHSLKQKLRGFGCGCVTILVLLVIVIVISTVNGVRQWVMPAVGGLIAHLPKAIPLSPELRSVIPPALSKLTPAEQIQLGREVVRQEGIDRNAFTDPTIDAVAARLLKVLPPQYRGPQSSGWEWRFQGMRTPDGQVNAIALPGGKIYVYDGLMKLANRDPNQLALVIGHEMGHVVEEHTAKQLRATGLLQSVVDMLGNNAGEGQGGEQPTGGIRALATSLGKEIVSMQLSQAAEFQADALGLQFMRTAGYDPKIGVQILERMDQLARASGPNNPLLGRIFSTHPPTPLRIQRLREQMGA